jgi:hypothetical protein
MAVDQAHKTCPDNVPALVAHPTAARSKAGLARQAFMLWFDNYARLPQVRRAAVSASMTRSVHI